MKLKSIVLLAVALGCGLVAMLGVQQALSGRKAPKEETAKVLVATAEISPGVPLDEGNTTFKSFPLSAVPQGAVTKREEFEERSMNVRAVPGEVIMLAKLSDKGVFGASAEIPEGMRVITVPVNATTTHSGLIRPGDRVDVLVTYKIRRPEQGMISKTKTVLEFIKVFATDSVRAGSAPESGELTAKNISLLVSPEQANLLMLAESKGQLHLALRHKSDDAAVMSGAVDETMFDDLEAKIGMDDAVEDETAPATQPTSVRDFLEQEQQGAAPVAITPAAPVEKPKWKIQIYAGDTQRIEEVDLPEEPKESASLPLDANDPSVGKIWKVLMQRFFVGA
jgi:pilus assembly protein CpaB